YSNIYITAPSPDNLKTFFEFVCKGFDALEYKEHLDYDVVKSANPDFKKAIVRINIIKQHRQTIQYIQPHEHEKLSQVELLVIDEAAAIPLPVVKSLLGPYLVFLSSTVSGYEGTGRSLSLKLLQQLDEQSRAPATGLEGSLSGCLFKKIELNESIRYASGDPIESWLNGLLCLDVATSLPNPSCHPRPSECDLYYVNRDTLFSYHKDSEMFLQNVLFLTMLIDIFRYFEGQISPILEADNEADVEHSPIRVTEAAEKVSMLEEQVKPRTNLPPLLVPLNERRPERLHYIGVSFGLTLDLFRFWRKHNFAPFYVSQIPVENLHPLSLIAISCSGFLTVAYSLCLDQSAVTGEHTSMLLKPLKNDELEVNESEELGFFAPFYKDFRIRFSKLLSDKFKKMDYKLAMSVLNPKINFTGIDSSDGFLKTLDGVLSPFDMERLRVFTNNMTDFNLVYDICKTLAHQYFEEKIPVSLSYVQASVLLCLGLQESEFSSIERQMQLERGQIHSLLLKVLRELYKYLNGIAAKEIEVARPRLQRRVLEPHNVSVDDDLREGAKQVEEQMKEKTEGSTDAELQQYVIGDTEAEALKHSKIPASGIVSVESTKLENQNGSDKTPKKRSKDKHSSESKSKSSKKRKA
ncbi:hypothetical protein F2Q70_00041087, partial [Brassica cretica]